MEAKQSNYKWWTEKKGEAHTTMIRLMRHIQNEQGYRRAENIRNARLYGNVDILGLSSYNYARSASNNLDGRVTMNVIQSCIDTVSAKIASKKPKPMFLTEKGDWDAQTKAKKLNKFVGGIFYDTDIYKKTAMNFKDGGVFGTSFLKVFSQNGKICAERVFPDEILIDDADGFYGCPQSIYQWKLVPRQELIAQYPKLRDEIALAPTVKSEDGILVSEVADQVLVGEGWHLAVMGEKDGEKYCIIPGRHVIAVESATLFDDTKWEKDSFPFAKYMYNPKLYGSWGQGISEILTGKQLEINRLLKNIQSAHYFCSNPMWMVEEGSKILSGHLNNAVGNIIKYKGMPPSLQVFSAVAPELYNHLMWLIQSSFEEVGVSQLSAASQNPLGANASGKALSTFNDFETERFSQVGQRWEEFHMEAATLIVDTAKDLYKNENVNLSVKSDSGAFVETIKFSEINLDQSKYIMKVFPVSAFSSTPAAKLQEVTEAVNSQMIDAETGLDLLDFPDIQSKMSLRTAKRKLIEQICERMIDKNEFTPAEPFMDLSYALEYGQNYYNLGKMNGVPDDKLELIRRFMSQAETIQAAANPEAQAVDMSGEIPAEDILAEQGIDAEGIPMEEPAQF